VLVEAKKDEKVEIPDEVTIENKVCSSSKLSPPFDRVLKWASSSMFSFVLSGSKGISICTHEPLPFMRFFSLSLLSEFLSHKLCMVL
jgi:hypothetical protein